MPGPDLNTPTPPTLDPLIAFTRRDLWLWRWSRYIAVAAWLASLVTFVERHMGFDGAAKIEQRLRAIEKALPPHGGQERC
jgi:hypothetical protein